MKLSNRLNAESKYREAFLRLKSGNPTVLPVGAPVSQNNVAREAGTDPSALRKSRFPALILEIQAYVEIVGAGEALESKRRATHAKRKLDSRRAQQLLVQQRDDAQSQLVQLQMKVLELAIENKRLEEELEALRPPVIKLR
ncbi:hypothetical protein [Bordetella genomosp. 12]|uniref:hypothetical protein n=1 Tax=Bordetella genomosp. 12 TaxID=463035 RepID=UPI0011784101|nr:hypothetical protein [Bordetella genomosp. 12]